MQLKPKNILLIGMMGSGKTTIAKYLEENYDYHHFAFANSLKDLAFKMLGRPIDKEKDRVFLQDLGNILRTPLKKQTHYDKQQIQKWMENGEFRKFVQNNSTKIFNPYLWCNQVYKTKRFENAFNKGKVVISDARYLNEINAFQNKQLKSNKIISSSIVYLDVEKEVCIKRIKERDNNFKPEWLEHVSENEWKNFGLNLLNGDIILSNIENASTEEIIRLIFN